MCTDFVLDRRRFAGLIPERVKKSQYNIGFQPTIKVTDDRHATDTVMLVLRDGRRCRQNM